MHLDAAGTGEVTISQNNFVPEVRAAAPAVVSPATVDHGHRAGPVAPVGTPTIAQRLNRRVPGNPYEGDNRVLARNMKLFS